MAECSRLGATSFPSLRLSIDGGILPVAVDYRDHRPMLAAITNLLET